MGGESGQVWRTGGPDISSVHFLIVRLVIGHSFLLPFFFSFVKSVFAETWKFPQTMKYLFSSSRLHTDVFFFWMWLLKVVEMLRMMLTIFNMSNSAFEKAQGILIPWNGESCYWVWIIGKWNIYISLFLKKYLSDETSWLCWGHTGQIFFSIIWYPQHNLSIRVSYNQPHNGSPWHDLLDLSHLWPCDLLGLRPLIPLLYSPTWQINGSIWNKWPQRGRLSRRFHTSLHA